MRTVSYVGFFVMLVVGFGAFAWADVWWATVLLLLAALAIGWYSLGLYARASQGAAFRALRGVASDDDLTELDRLGDRAMEEAVARASAAPDPQRDRLFEQFITQVGGLQSARELVMEHMERHGFDFNEDAADGFLDAWRRYGIVRNKSLGEYLDDAASRL